MEPEGSPRVLAHAGETDESAAIAADLVRHAAVGLYRLDADGRLVHANLALARLLAHPSVEELLPARAAFRTDLYADTGHADRLAGHLDRHGHVERLEAEVVCADKKHMWVAETAVVLRDAAGRKTGEAGTLIDIDERRGAEEALARSEEKYRTLAEHSQDGIYVLQDGRIAYANPVLTHMGGYEPEEVVGEKAERFFAAGEREMVRKIRALRDSGDQEEFYYETRLLAKDGKTEVPVSIKSGPIRYLGETAIVGTVRDLREIYADKRRTESARARYRNFVKHAGVGIYRSTPSGKLLSANPALVRLLGYASRGELRAQITNVCDLYAVPAERNSTLVKLEAEGIFKARELRLRRRNGTVIWVAETARVVRDEESRPLYYEGMLEDISARKKVERELRFRTTHDALTNLPNRKLFGGYLSAALKAARRRGRAEHALVFADLNTLRRVNESLGHSPGDLLLQETVRRLQRAVGPRDVLCRYSGDKFALLAAGVSTRIAAEALAARIEATLENPFIIRGHEIYPRVSLGIVLCTPDYANTEAVLHDADTALNACGGEDQTGHVIFDETIRNAATERLQLESDMRAGLERGEFEMHYQPICDIVKRRIVAFEALLRWRHPRQGLLLPELFLPIAEETGLIFELGDMGFQASLRDCLTWQESGAEIAVAFNLSNSQFNADRLPTTIAAGLEHSGLPAQLLHLEVTEEVFMADQARARRIFERLHKLGVKFHLDDYGTGNAGLSWLREFPFDALKLDRSYVKEIPRDWRTRSILRNVIGLARDLDMSAIAEGVEREEQVAALRQMNCALAQGFYYGAAVEPEAARALLIDNA